tara:strand:+ start:2568 stop:3092 length:525 start_codon:yes stop_codon:yes gene_type:complete
MKLLREYIRESLMYHSTAPDNVSAIQLAGLQIGRESAHTAAGSWADDHYNTRPIYVSVERGKYTGQPLEVDTSGLTLVADLPTLVDSGANVEEEVLWWDEGAEPPALVPFLEMGEIQIFDLLNDPDVIQAAINTTGTAAVLEDIPPDRIRISEVREYIRALLTEAARQPEDFRR